jgi:hypothetical protein
MTRTRTAMHATYRVSGFEKDARKKSGIFEVK